MSDNLHNKNKYNKKDKAFKSYFRDYTGESNNVSIDNGEGSVPYGWFKVKEYKYCFKCTKELPEGSTMAFCNDWCHSEYYKEIAADMDDIIGIN